MRPSHPVLGYAKVIEVPEGDWPYNIREKWVGLVLPFIGIKPYIKGSGKLIGSDIPAPPRQRPCNFEIHVTYDDAWMAIQEKPDFVKWWQELTAEGLLKSDGTLCFGGTEVEIVGMELS